ncbi:MAG TPA: PLDc N-terminal domain-containing protein [bacterium]|nr:PLDc N-terminal domain-containing protein [bacterium]
MTAGILGLAIFISDIVAIAIVLQSRMGTGRKFSWCLLILMLPVAGWLLWFFAAPRK